MQCPAILFGKRTWRQSLWDGDAVYAFTAKSGDEQCAPVAKWRGIVKDGFFRISSCRLLQISCKGGKQSTYMVLFGAITMNYAK
jgi:hypothetical protein